MTMEIDFYFDFLSPYSYFAWRMWREKFQSRYSPGDGVKFRWKPVSLPQIMARTGNVPPAIIPARAAYILGDLHRIAEYHELTPFKMPETFPFDTRPMLWTLLTQMMGAESEGDLKDSEERQAAFIDAVWKRIFQDGCTAFPISIDEEAIQRAKSKLRKFTDEALQAGAFGVPYWRIKDNATGRSECFFGSDRFHLIKVFLQRHTNPKPLSKL